jgi:hypothetical protein
MTWGAAASTAMVARVTGERMVLGDDDVWCSRQDCNGGYHGEQGEQDQTQPEKQKRKYFIVCLILCA